MNFYYDIKLVEFFDVSVIMVVDDATVVNDMLRCNEKYFMRNGIELLLMLRTSALKKQTSAVLQDFPFLNTHIISADESLATVDDGFLLCAGVLHARYNHILFIRQDVQFFTDVLFRLRYLLQYYAAGYAKAAPGDYVTAASAHLPFSLMLKRQELHAAEQAFQGKAFTDFVAAVCQYLDVRGKRGIVCAQAIEGYIKSVHSKTSFAVHHGAKMRVADDDESLTDLERFAIHSQKANGYGGGQARLQQYADFAKGFKKTWIRDLSVFGQQYGIIALVQVKNEIRHLPEVLLHLDSCCDGIILLDDDSTDGSFDAAMSEKLLLKVQKGTDSIFDDLLLRNLLLKLAAFFRSDWLFFFDADERFDPRYADLYSIAGQTDADTISFHFVHLWDGEDHYRKDFPGNASGVFIYPRMFRHYGFMQIHSNQKIHFPATPFQRKTTAAPVLVRHFGNIDPQIRKLKYKRYMGQDKDCQSLFHDYEYLLSENVKLVDIEAPELPSSFYNSLNQYRDCIQTT